MEAIDTEVCSKEVMFERNILRDPVAVIMVSLSFFWDPLFLSAFLLLALVHLSSLLFFAGDNMPSGSFCLYRPRDCCAPNSADPAEHFGLLFRSCRLLSLCTRMFVRTAENRSTAHRAGARLPVLPHQSSRILPLCQGCSAIWRNVVP